MKSGDCMGSFHPLMDRGLRNATLGVLFRPDQLKENPQIVDPRNMEIHFCGYPCRNGTPARFSSPKLLYSRDGESLIPLFENLLSTWLHVTGYMLKCVSTCMVPVQAVVDVHNSHKVGKRASCCGPCNDSCLRGFDL